VETKSEIMQHVLKMQFISLLPKYVEYLAMQAKMLICTCTDGRNYPQKVPKQIQKSISPCFTSFKINKLLTGEHILNRFLVREEEHKGYCLNSSLGEKII
jgi:hypothetical protein